MLFVSHLCRSSSIRALVSFSPLSVLISICQLLLMLLGDHILYWHFCVFLHAHLTLASYPSFHLCVETQQSRHSQRLYRTTSLRWTFWHQHAMMPRTTTGMLHVCYLANTTVRICFAMKTIVMPALFFHQTSSVLKCCQSSVYVSCSARIFAVFIPSLFNTTNNLH